MEGWPKNADALANSILIFINSKQLHQRRPQTVGEIRRIWHAACCIPYTSSGGACSGGSSSSSSSRRKFRSLTSDNMQS